MKGEIRAQRPTLTSFQGGRVDARNSRLLERIQERQRDGARQATLTLGRKRDGKPELYGQQASVLVLDTGARRSPVEREVQAVSFEGTGKTSRGKTGPLATAIAAGLLVLIAPNLGTAEPTRASATVQVETEDNPFGFKKGKTRVKEIGKLLGAKGIEEMEWIVEDYNRAGTTLLVADGVKALYWFNKSGVYEGRLLDLSTLDNADLSKARNWTITTSSSGKTFVTAENFLARGSSGEWKPAVLMVGVEQDGQAHVHLQQMGAIVSAEGGFRNPRLQRAGSLVLLYADREDGTPWANVYAFSGSTGQPKGVRPADQEFLKQVGLAMAVP